LCLMLLMLSPTDRPSPTVHLKAIYLCQCTGKTLQSDSYTHTHPLTHCLCFGLQSLHCVTKFQMEAQNFYSIILLTMEFGCSVETGDRVQLRSPQCHPQ